MPSDWSTPTGFDRMEVESLAELTAFQRSRFGGPQR
jgi:hypothetical protein